MVDSDELNTKYTQKEVREGIKRFFELPDDYPLKMELARVVPLLGWEWRSVFILYASGVPLIGISAYWRALFPKRLRGNSKQTYKNYGHKIVVGLITRILDFLGTDVQPIDIRVLADSSRVVRAQITGLQQPSGV